MKIRVLSLAFFAFLMTGISTGAHALELDWTGSFKSEFNYVHNYSMDNSDAGSNTDPVRAGTPANTPGGYYVPGGGQNDATWETLFMRVNPKIVVNDNVYIKSEWWLGDPVYGIFGNAVPYTTDQRQFYSTQSRGSYISAQRLWAEFLTDFGTIQVGRAPLDWGLGVVWSAGDGVFNHYQSTGDSVRLISKFGAFSFIPSFTEISTGNTIGGACVISPTSGACAEAPGSGAVAMYSLILKYENPDEDFEGGVNVIKRISGSAQDVNGGLLGPQASNLAPGMNYNIFSLYGKKRLGKLTLSGEIPITNGYVGSTPDPNNQNNGQLDYSTFALALEANYKSSDTWETMIKAGHAPGQPNESNSGFLDRYRAFYFNPNYQIAMIMFNYQLRNFSGLNTANNPIAGSTGAGGLVSPYDNPVVNANYLTVGESLHADKWTLKANWIYALAPTSATQGQYFYNYWDRTLGGAKQNGTGTPQQAIKSQGNNLGMEFDTGATFQWDESFQFGLDFGLYLPGNFYAFSNSAQDNATSMVFAASARVGVVF